MKTPAVLRPTEPTPTHEQHPRLSPASLINPVSRQLGFVLHLIIVLKILMASRFCLDTSDDSNQTFVLGETICQSRNHWSTITLAIIWLLLHVILFLDIKFPSIITNHVRLVTPHMD